MKATNLTEENVNDLQEQMEAMKKLNPELKYEFFNQSAKEPTEVEIQLAQIQTDLTALKAKIDLIFGDAVLFGDGQFHSIKK